MKTDIEKIMEMKRESNKIMSSVNRESQYPTVNSSKNLLGSIKTSFVTKLKSTNEKVMDFLMTYHEIDDGAEDIDDDYYVSPEEEMNAYFAAMEKAAKEVVSKYMSEDSIDMTNKKNNGRVRTRYNKGSLEVLLIILIVSMALGAILALVLHS